MRRSSLLVSLLTLVTAFGCATQSDVVTVPAPAPVVTPAEPPAPAGPTAEEAAAFIERAEARLYDLGVKASRAQWVSSNFISHDTQILAADASEKVIAAGVELAKEAARFDGVDVPYDVRRKLNILKNGLTTPAPGDPQSTQELARILAKMEANYGEAKYCPTPDRCLAVGDIGRIMATSRNPKELLDVWRGWRTTSPPIRDDYRRFVELTNAGSKELGFDNTGELWRSGYDMPPDEFAKEVDRLWLQVKPLYDSLHCYVRGQLSKRYGSDVVGTDGMIPAHLLGNIWAQEWGNIYELVAPPKSTPGYDLTERLKKKNVDAIEMVKIGERFFTSLGLEPLPKTFWERSLFTKPRDREVVCHASAWNVDEVDDLRIKMCIEPTAEDFQTIHHELGHNFYQRAYNQLPYLYRNSANDGFHEALGDAVALSITPEYLKQIGMIDKVPPASADTGLLLRDGLDKIAFLPWGLLVDKWRWGVFSGEITPATYNQAWWDLREKYQGVRAPIDRPADAFDPGAKYHIPGNTPYMRYFLARVLQFQFHRSLCEAAGQTGPLHRCTIYGSREAGRRLNEMMEMGASRPWPDALEALTGSRQIDATAMVDYFAPLREWLDKQNEGKTCGW